jgi:hypothetical protein
MIVLVNHGKKNDKNFKLQNKFRKIESHNVPLKLWFSWVGLVKKITYFVFHLLPNLENYLNGNFK